MKVIYPKFLEELDVLIILNANIGHLPFRISIINGAIGHIKDKNGNGTITFELKLKYGRLL